MTECVLIAHNFLQFALITTSVSSMQPRASELDLFNPAPFLIPYAILYYNS